jgi:serine/threonine-protein kinase RsbW
MSNKLAGSPHQLQLVFESAFHHLDELLVQTERFVSAHTSDEDRIYQIVLLTSEAVTNAIEHGNQLDPTKQVHVDMIVENGCLTVSVQDEGAGFSRTTVRDPLTEDNLFKEGGRGIFLIEEMADEVHYEMDGRKVNMVFQLDAS